MHPPQRSLAVLALLLASLCANAAPAQGNLVQNGSFEILLPGWSGVSNWVGANSYAIAEPSRAADGTNYLLAHGSYYQDIATVPNQTYIFKMAFGGHVEPDWPGNPLPIEPLQVLWDSQVFATIPYTPVPYGSPKWTYFQYQQVATSNWTRIGFNNPSGQSPAYIDDVSVVPPGQNVVGWGYDYTPVPAGLADVVAIAAGFGYSLALKRDGTVAGWGNYWTTPSTKVPVTVPPGLSNVAAIAAGNWHSLALKSDGTVVAWGYYNSSGQIDVPSGLDHVVAIAAGTRHSLALKDDGTVVAWGKSATNVPPDLKNVIAIAAGSGCIALKADGTIAVWGPWQSGNKVPADLTNVVAIAGAYFGWLALKSDGTVVDSFTSEGPPPGLSSVIAISGSSGNDGHVNLALKADHTVVGWGFDHFTGPIPASLSNVVAIAAGGYHNLALLAYGPPFIAEQPLSRTVEVNGATRLRVAATGGLPVSYQWKLNGLDLPGATDAILSLANIQPEQAGFYSVTVSNSSGLVTSRDALLNVNSILISQDPLTQCAFLGSTVVFEPVIKGQGPFRYQWEKGEMDLPGQTNKNLILPNVQLLDRGDYKLRITNPYQSALSSVASLSIVDVAAWGRLPQNSVPGDLTNTLAISAGWKHALALNADGSVTAFGDDSYGETIVPAGLTNVMAVAAGGIHSVALNHDGTLAVWGSTAYGLSIISPEMTNLVAISSGVSHSMALRADGEVFVWGYNGYGLTNVPPDLHDVVSISAQGTSCLALEEDGTAVSWGELGPAPHLPFLQAVSCGESHGLGLAADMTVSAWGADYSQQTDVPIGLSNVVAISGGDDHSLALTAEGKVTSWGFNLAGQTNVPVDLRNVVAIAAGSDSSLALVGPAPPVLSVAVTNVTLGGEGFCVSIPTRSGRVYRLEYKDPANDQSWAKLPLVAGNGHIRKLIDPTMTASSRFYRVRQW